MTDVTKKDIEQEIARIEDFIFKRLEDMRGLSEYRPLHMAIQTATMGLRYVIRSLEEILNDTEAFRDE